MIDEKNSDPIDSEGTVDNVDADNVDDTDGVAPEVPLISPERKSRIEEQSGHDIEWFSNAHAVLIQHDQDGNLGWAIDCPNLGHAENASADNSDSDTELETSCIVLGDDGSCRCGLYDDTLFSIKQLETVEAADATKPRPATWIEQLAHDHGEGTFFVELSTTTVTCADGESYVVRCGCNPVRVEGAPVSDIDQL